MDRDVNLISVIRENIEILEIEIAKLNLQAKYIATNIGTQKRRLKTISKLIGAEKSNYVNNLIEKILKTKDMNYRELNGISINDGFQKFHIENPHIYEEFENQVIMAIDRGRTKLSAKLIINWIRWNETLRSSDVNFKINDAYQSYYARLFVEKHPEHSRIFEFRKLRNEEDKPYMLAGSDGKLEFL